MRMQINLIDNDFSPGIFKEGEKYIPNLTILQSVPSPNNEMISWQIKGNIMKSD